MAFWLLNRNLQSRASLDCRVTLSRLPLLEVSSAATARLSACAGSAGVLRMLSQSACVSALDALSAAAESAAPAAHQTATQCAKQQITSA